MKMIHVGALVRTLVEGLTVLIGTALGMWRYSVSNRWQRRKFMRQARNLMKASQRRYRVPDYVLNQSAAPASLPPGALFGVPGFTQSTEQRENNDGFTVTLAQTNQTDVLSAGIANFKQTDVLTWWEIDLALTSTYTTGTSVITLSPYFPWNFMQQTVLSVQNLFKPLEVLSGIDLAIFQVLRPMRQNSYGQNMLFTSPFGEASALFSAWQSPTTGQANLVTARNMLVGTTAINLSFELPASIYFDIYYHLDKNGSPVAGVQQPQRAIVSPVYMAGSARYVQPQLRFAAGTSPNLDFAPANIGAGTGTFTGSAKMAAVRRVGFYGSNDPRVLPPVMNPWQYRRMSTNFSVAGRSIVDIPLQAVSNPGQILMIFIRMWDPAAAAGLGAPVNITTLTRCMIQYGSSLLRFDDTPLQAQRRIMEQHSVLLPQGVLAWDFALDMYGRLTNAYALNTLTTAGVNIHLEASSPFSTSAYIVVGTELLVVVE